LESLTEVVSQASTKSSEFFRQDIF
jgi:hypothetical protein